MFGGGAAALFVGFVLGAIGVGYLMYARRAASVPALACGAVLLVFPWFVTSLWVLVVCGGGVAMLPLVGGRLGWW